MIQSRPVARGFKMKGDNDRFDIFAAMPPLEAKRMLFRMAMLMNCDKTHLVKRKDKA